ncbi:hypothetical protein [Tomitella fengzijianii]|uniref:Minor tail protein n=1 Tax=Tomitella fengzijianii TaxID=2597660 RepID=A0A516X4J1_9ACTN|nr:hypothetical protein [Tomitella fengzijianii]QDQ97992.1 hypothetical protein FO059_12530 [Tomitella fengzijianii]
MSTRTVATVPGIDPALAREFAQAFAGTSALQDVIDTIVGAAGSALEDLADWVANVPDMIGRMVNQVVDIFNGLVVTPINDAIQGVLDWFRGLLGFRQDTSEQVQETENTVNNQGTIIQGISDDLVDNATLADVPNNLPMWQSLNPLEDPSFPRVMLNRGQKDGAWYRPAADRMELAFIRPARSRKYNTIGCIVDNSEDATSDAYLAVYRVMEDGALDLVDVTGNIADTMTAARSEVRVQLDEDLMVEAGSYIAVGILQTGGTTRYLAGLDDENVAVPVGTYPPKINALSAGGTTSPPDTITSGEIDFSQSWIPWVCLGESIPDTDEQPLSYRDTFDRPDGGLGHDWATRGSFRVLDRKAQLGANPSGGFHTALWVYPLHRDDHQASAIVAKNDTLQAPGFVMVRGNNRFTRGMIAYWIQRSSGSWEVGLNYATGINTYGRAYPDTPAVTFPANSRVTLRAIGDRYIVTVNGEEVIEHRDTAGHVPIGPANRFVGFGLWANPAGRYGAPLEEWSAKDLNRELLEYPAEDRYPSRLTYPSAPGTGTGGGNSDGDDNTESED